MKYISTLYSNSSVDNANVTFGHRIEFTYNERKAVFLYWVCREYSTYLGRLAGTVSTGGGLRDISKGSIT